MCSSLLWFDLMGVAFAAAANWTAESCMNWSATCGDDASPPRMASVLRPASIRGDLAEKTWSHVVPCSAKSRCIICIMALGSLGSPLGLLPPGPHIKASMPQGILARLDAPRLGSRHHACHTLHQSESVQFVPMEQQLTARCMHYTKCKTHTC